MYVNSVRKINLEERIFFSLRIKDDLQGQIENELARSDLNSESAREFADFLKSLLQIIDMHLNWYYRKQLDELTEGEGENIEAGFSDIESQIYEASLLVKKLTPMSKFVAGARAPTNHWSLVTLLERFCKSLYPEARVIIRPRWEYNYSYISLKDEVVRIADSTNFSDAKISKAIQVQINNSLHFFSLAYPPTSTYNLLMSAIWSHELAHLADNIEASYENKKINQELVGETSLPSDQVEYLSTKLLRDFSSKPPEEIYDALFSSLLKGTKLYSDEEKRKLSAQLFERIAALVHVWARELFADIFSIHMFGPAALLAYLEFIGPNSKRLDVSSNIYYPTERIRLKAMLQEYYRWSSDSDWVKGYPKEISSSLDKELTYLNELLDTEFDDAIIPPLEELTEWPDQKFINIIYKVLYENRDVFIQKIYPLVNQIKNRNLNSFIQPSDLKQLVPQVADLSNNLPPTFNVSQENENKILGLVVNVGWLGWLSQKYYGRSNAFPGYEEKNKAFEGINLLLQKSIENAETIRWFEKRRVFGKQHFPTETANISAAHNEIAHDLLNSGAVMSNIELTQRVQKDLKIIPLLDAKSQIGSCSIDIRLGNQFIVTQTPLVASLDSIEFENMEFAGELQNKMSLPLGRPFVLHPGQFVLGSTLEFFSIPNDLMGLLIGRSSWGRLGFVISTPNKVVPGFNGCLTLQLSNLGNVPILLYPSARIGQVVFFYMHRGRD